MILRSIVLSFTLAVFCLTACRKEPTSTNEANQPDGPLAATPAPTAPPAPTPEVVLAAPAEFAKELVGTMDDKLHIQMKLTRKGNQLSGDYFYDRPGAINVASKLIRLTGKIEKDGKTTLTEWAAKPQGEGEEKTGELKGALDAVIINGAPALRFLGLWTSLKNNKSVPFSLQERRFDLGGYRLSGRELEEKNKKLRMEIALRVPQLAGVDAAGAEQFNQVINDLVSVQIRHFKKEVIELAKGAQELAQAEPKKVPSGETTDQQAAPQAEPKPAENGESFNTLEGGYEVSFAHPELVSVLLHYSVYYRGSAHPNSFSTALTYDLKRGVEVKLAELFAPKSNYLKLISDYCIKELKKLDTADAAESGAGPKLENFASWNVTSVGLKFTFDPYEVGAYVYGAHEVIVPYAVLKPVLKIDGLRAPLAQG